jgi:hypothetical protein
LPPGHLLAAVLLAAVLLTPGLLTPGLLTPGLLTSGWLTSGWLTSGWLTPSPLARGPLARRPLRRPRPPGLDVVAVLLGLVEIGGLAGLPGLLAFPVVGSIAAGRPVVGGVATAGPVAGGIAAGRPVAGRVLFLLPDRVSPRVAAGRPRLHSVAGAVVLVVGMVPGVRGVAVPAGIA